MFGRNRLSIQYLLLIMHISNEKIVGLQKAPTAYEFQMRILEDNANVAIEDISTSLEICKPCRIILCVFIFC